MGLLASHAIRECAKCASSKEATTMNQVDKVEKIARETARSREDVSCFVQKSGPSKSASNRALQLRIIDRFSTPADVRLLKLLAMSLRAYSLP
jgi:hypothetical protein